MQAVKLCCCAVAEQERDGWHAVGGGYPWAGGKIGGGLQCEVRTCGRGPEHDDLSAAGGDGERRQISADNIKRERLHEAAAQAVRSLHGEIEHAGGRERPGNESVRGQ